MEEEEEEQDLVIDMTKQDISLA